MRYLSVLCPLLIRVVMGFCVMFAHGVAQSCASYVLFSCALCVILIHSGRSPVACLCVMRRAGVLYHSLLCAMLCYMLFYAFASCVISLRLAHLSDCLLCYSCAGLRLGFVLFFSSMPFSFNDLRFLVASPCRLMLYCPPAVSLGSVAAPKIMRNMMRR